MTYVRLTCMRKNDSYNYQPVVVHEGTIWQTIFKHLNLISPIPYMDATGRRVHSCVSITRDDGTDGKTSSTEKVWWIKNRHGDIFD